MLASLGDLFGAKTAPRRGGSKMGCRKAKEKRRSEGYCLLYSDYFADVPLHGEKVFRRRYRMGRKLFLRIVNSLREYDNYFVCERLHRHSWVLLTSEVYNGHEDACIWSSW